MNKPLDNWKSKMKKEGGSEVVFIDNETHIQALIPIGIYSKTAKSGSPTRAPN